jgi:hypothetical protein
MAGSTLDARKPVRPATVLGLLLERKPPSIAGLPPHTVALTPGQNSERASKRGDGVVDQIEARRVSAKCLRNSLGLEIMRSGDRPVWMDRHGVFGTSSAGATRAALEGELEGTAIRG